MEEAEAMQLLHQGLGKKRDKVCNGFPGLCSEIAGGVSGMLQPVTEQDMNITEDLAADRFHHSAKQVGDEVRNAI